MSPIRIQLHVFQSSRICCVRLFLVLNPTYSDIFMVVEYHHHLRPCCLEISHYYPFIVNIHFQDVFVLFSDHDIDDLEMQVVRYKPEGLDILCRNTKFTKKELQIMYRGFKQVRHQ